MSAEQIEPVLERDLSRAHWQRSVGTVVMNECIDMCLEQASRIDFSRPENLDRIMDWGQSIRSARHITYPWSDAYGVSNLVFEKINPLLLPLGSVPSWLQTDLKRYTFKATIYGIVEEGMSTQAAFPLNMLLGVSDWAEGQRVAGYSAESFGDVAGMLLKPDMQRMLNTAALTGNGFWANKSTTATDNLFYANFGANSLQITGHGIGFSRHATQLLSDDMRLKNAAAIPTGLAVPANVEHLSSSGCPVRSLRPQFTDSVADQMKLASLAEYFKKTPEELTAPREESGIIKCANYLANVLVELDDPYRRYTGTETYSTTQ